MSRSRATLVVSGQVIVSASAGRFETVEAIGIADGRVVAAGRRDEVLGSAAPAARHVDAGDAAVVPGIHDFHIHLVGLARSRAGVDLDGARDARDVADRISAHAADLPPDAWLTGRGWSDRQLRDGVGLLVETIGDRAAYLASHDGHSAWASPAALRSAGVDASTPDPDGGRIEHDADGRPTGILRETALDLVAGHVPRLQGAELRPSLDATLAELAAFGITGASEAGDYTDENGTGDDAALGDSYSTLTDLGDQVDGRLRLTLGIPVDALPVAARRGLRTGARLDGRATMRFGWAKEYADGALGSATAALFEPHSCGEGDTGILRVDAEELDSLLATARRAGIGLAIHAIGDRAAATVLDAAQRAGPSRSTAADRVEHVQLLRPVDRPRFARLGLTASIQPIHAAADRDLVEACWADREHLAYPWRALAGDGVLLAAGSDAPVESVNPWRGIFAAVHRRMPEDARGDWRAEQALSVGEALAAYTRGPARAIGAADEGHLGIGARADLSVLTIGLRALQAADEELAEAASALTMVGGREVHRS
jgi:predicted amidohydrolase YtcJ